MAMIPDGRAEVPERLARDGAAFFRDIFDEVAVLTHQVWSTSQIQIDVELRHASVLLRERVSKAALFAAAVDDPQQPRLQMRAFGPRTKGCVDFSFIATAEGRLAVGEREALDPAGVARRAVDLLLAIARPETTVDPERRQINR
jgi:hypothetical protein